MDLSKFSTEDLQALRARDLSKMSTEGLKNLRSATAQAQEEGDGTQSSLDLVDAAKTGVGVAAKMGNMLWPLAGVPAGMGLSALTGKKTFSTGELADQYLNVIPGHGGNLKTFPSLDQMAERAGVPKGGKLSDVVSGYAKPGSEHPWYQPEQGGLLDPTLRGTAAGTLQMGLDPATYLLPEMKAGEKVLNAFRGENANVVRAGLQKLLGAGSGVVNGIGSVGPKYLGKALGESAVGPALRAATNPIGTAVTALGKGLYRPAVLPIEHQGEKFGKSEVTNSLYQAGIMSPHGLQDSARGAKDALGRAQGSLIQEADAAGARGSMEQAVQPAREAVQGLRARSATPEAQKLADDLEQGIQGYVERERGTPPTPGSPGEPPTLGTVDSKILDERGQPFQRTVLTSPGTPPTAGSPGRPGIPSTAQRLTNEKSWLYDNEFPKTAWEQARKTGAGEGVQKQLARGLKEETERAVQQATGKGADLADINRAYGGLASTMPAQRFVEQRAERQAANLGQITGLDAGGEALVHAASGMSSKALSPFILMKKGLQAVSQGTMPMGYLLRMLGESNTLDRLNSMSQSKKPGGR